MELSESMREAKDLLLTRGTIIYYILIDRSIYMIKTLVHLGCNNDEGLNIWTDKIYLLKYSIHCI